MKSYFHYTYPLIGLLIFSLCSCSKFLDVTPKTETPQDVLFNSEAGFKDALTGVYIQMKSEDAYGKALSYGTLEYMTSSWDVSSNTWQERIGEFNFSDEEVESELNAVYGQLYAVIASANAILGKIDEKQSVFETPGMYEMIKAECLAIRAYCHLDAIRLFGPIPSNPAQGNQLPYVTELSREINAPVSFAAFKKALLADLSSAEALLKEVDPILDYSIDALRTPGENGAFNPNDTYMAYRYIRMNYYAVRALQARASLWFNEPQQAGEHARFVIDALNEDGSAKFALGTAADMSRGNYVLTSEHLFGLYDFDMGNTFSDDFLSGSFAKGSTESTINTQLYENSGSDIRESYLWEAITLENQAKHYIIKKYQPKADPASLADDFRQIPMLRLSEMFLIAAEVMPLGEAQAYWETFLSARNLEPTSLPADPNFRTQEIVKEFRKEFYAEGQAFFTYKRLNIEGEDFLFLPSSATVNYLLPMPASENIHTN